jgi:AraC family transcriptional regulator
MGSLGRARLAFAQGLSVWVLEAPAGFGEPSFHSHHAIQLTACLSGNLALSSASGTLRAPALAVAPDYNHQLSADGLMGFVFVEPESREGRALRARLFGDRSLVAIDDKAFLHAFAALGGAFDGPMPHEEMVLLGRRVIETLVSSEPVESPDPRIQRIIDYAASNLDKPLHESAEMAGVYLSEGRLRHLFVEQTGLPFKTYLVWLRLQSAVRHYSEGSSLTEAAHAAGFADSAHFSRMFKRTFGTPATLLTRL